MHSLSFLFYLTLTGFYYTYSHALFDRDNTVVIPTKIQCDPRSCDVPNIEVTTSETNVMIESHHMHNVYPKPFYDSCEPIVQIYSIITETFVSKSTNSQSSSLDSIYGKVLKLTNRKKKLKFNKEKRILSVRPVEYTTS